MRVGRSIQADNFWATLLPDETLRNTVSREQFEVTVEEFGPQLNNLSNGGTFVNGERVHGQARLSSGDKVGVGVLAHDERPSLTFRFMSAADQAEDYGMQCI